MIVYGGYLDLGRSGDIYVYYFNENRWEKINPTSSAAPEPRSGHSAVIHGDNMVIFGGKNNDNQKINDIWSFNIPSAQWT
jgi:N-acetylneuraminic acid mutarotase